MRFSASSLQYPLEQFTSKNIAEDNRCVSAAEEIIIASHSPSSISPIAGFIIEPIQGQGGDNHANPSFFSKIRNICSRHGIAFIIDEVQTGV